MKSKLRFDILTIFPELFESYLKQGLIDKALKKKVIEIRLHNIRDFSGNKHHKVDGAPYGGGAGMIMGVEPIYQCLKSVKKRKKHKVVLLDPRGKRYNQKTASRYSKYDQLIFICGRYEGVDERVKELVDESVSIGDYILSGGEIAALAIVESTSRLIKGYLGDPESLKNETFTQRDKVNRYPQYTKPRNFKLGNKIFTVPEILFSGDHKKIREWREKNRFNNN